MTKKIMLIGMLVAAVTLTGCFTSGSGKAKKTKLDPIDSKIFQGVLYEEESQNLTLQFNNGGTYRYAEVPKEVYEKFLAAEDKGAFFLGEIKDKYVGKYVFED